MRVAFIYHQGRLARMDAARRGEVPTEFFYGAIEMEREGVEVRQFEVDETRAGAVWRALDSALPRQMFPVKTGLPLLMAVRPLLAELNRFDCVVATAGNIGFALALWSLVGAFRRPLAAIHSGILDYRHNAWRRALTRRLFSRMHTILFGDAELEPMRHAFSIPAEKISVNQFGVDKNFWTPGGGSDGSVLSVGNDGRRDFDTLCAAAAKIYAPVRIVTSRKLSASLPPNVGVIRGDWHAAALSDADLRALYRKAACVVVPIRETLQPSGQSVALQAMACGRPVVLTRTGGLWSRTMMRDGDNVLFAQPGDADDLAEKIRRVLADATLAGALGRSGRTTVEREATIGGFAHRIHEVCARIANRPDDQLH